MNNMCDILNAIIDAERVDINEFDRTAVRRAMLNTRYRKIQSGYMNLNSTMNQIKVIILISLALGNNFSKIAEYFQKKYLAKDKNGKEIASIIRQLEATFNLTHYIGGSKIFLGRVAQSFPEITVSLNEQYGKGPVTLETYKTHSSSFSGCFMGYPLAYLYSGSKEKDLVTILLWSTYKSNEVTNVKHRLWLEENVGERLERLSRHISNALKSSMFTKAEREILINKLKLENLDDMIIAVYKELFPDELFQNCVEIVGNETEIINDND